MHKPRQIVNAEALTGLYQRCHFRSNFRSRLRIGAAEIPRRPSSGRIGRGHPLLSRHPGAGHRWRLAAACAGRLELRCQTSCIERPSSSAERQLHQQLASQRRNEPFPYAPGISSRDFTDSTWPAPPGGSCENTQLPGDVPLVKNSF